VWTTKKYGDHGASEVVAKERRILPAMLRHIEEVKAADDPESVVTTNPKGVIYGFGRDIGHFSQNKDCAFRLRFILW
jgi:hypothetical protein